MKNKAQNIELEGVSWNDYPDFCDAYISYAEHENGEPFTDVELDTLNEDGLFVHQQAMDELF